MRFHYRRRARLSITCSGSCQAITRFRPMSEINWPTPLGAGGVPAPSYCNAVQMWFSQWDFAFEFSLLAAVPPSEAGQQPQVMKYVVDRVIMSPQHAKAFLDVLRKNVEQFEQQHGELQVPDVATVEGE